MRNMKARLLSTLLVFCLMASLLASSVFATTDSDIHNTNNTIVEETKTNEPTVGEGENTENEPSQENGDPTTDGEDGEGKPEISDSEDAPTDMLQETNEGETPDETVGEGLNQPNQAEQEETPEEPEGEPMFFALQEVVAEAVASANDETFATLQEAIDAAAQGSTVTLLENVDLGSAEVTIGKSITLDLNGKKLEGAGPRVILADSASDRIEVTITNGTVENTRTGVFVYENGSRVSSTSAVKAYGNVEMTLSRVTLASNRNAEKWNYALIIEPKNNLSPVVTVTGDSVLSATNCASGAGVSFFGTTDGDAVQLIVESGTITGSSYGIAGNGGANNIHITINGGTILGTDEDAVGIYHPQLQSALTVNGGTISGGTGIEIRSGSLKVTGGEIVGTYVPTQTEGNDNGITTLGAGIAVAPYGGTGREIDVCVTGGEISGYHAFYESNPNNVADFDVTIGIAGGTFTAINGGTVAVYSQNYTGFIGGGTFNGTLGETYYAVAEANGKYYASLADAVASVTDSTETTITLLKDVDNGTGIIVAEGSNIVFDFNGKTYTIAGPMVGSDGTVSNGFQLLGYKGTSNITMKNGTIKAGNDGCKILIQNYSNLTLTNMTLDGDSRETCQYLLSNNNGNVLLNGNTNIYAANGSVALDVYYWPDGGYGAVSVTVDTIGEIVGKIEVGTDGTDMNNSDRAQLTVKNATINGDIVAYGMGADKEANILLGNVVFVNDVTDKGYSKYEAVAMANGNYYTSLADALASVTDGTETTITLLKDVDNGTGIVVAEGSNIVFDFNGFTYTITNDTVGSPNTTSNGFQLLGYKTISNITMKNGTIKAASDGCYILIQNYSNLTLTDMTLDGNGLQTCQYLLSNNNGNVLLNGNTHIYAADGQVAFDVWANASYKDGVRVTVDTTGIIQGKIEYAWSASADADTVENTSLTINNGKFIGEMSVQDSNAAHISITGGTFSNLPKDYIAGSSHVSSGNVVHKMEMTEVAAVAPTYTAAGNLQYWICSGCGQMYADAEGRQATDLAAVTLPKLTAPTVEVTETPSTSTDSSTNTDSSTASSSASSTTTNRRPSASGAASGVVSDVAEEEPGEEIAEETTPLAPPADEVDETSAAEENTATAETVSAEKESGSSVLLIAGIAFVALAAIGGVVVITTRREKRS